MRLENWVFLQMLFLEEESENQQKLFIYRTMLFISKQVSLSKISLMLQKM